MKQHLRQELKNVFDAPQPLHKRAFLRALEQPKISIFAFVLTQLGYIRRWVWIVSALVFVLSAAGAAGLPSDTVWVASALMPLLALTVVSESGRSQNYEMAELEMATRFSLRSVVLARLGILGMENLIVLVLLLPGRNRAAGRHCGTGRRLCPGALSDDDVFRSVDRPQDPWARGGLYLCRHRGLHQLSDDGAAGQHRAILPGGQRHVGDRRCAPAVDRNDAAVCGHRQ